jgi:hypothetical protein
MVVKELCRIFFFIYRLRMYTRIHLYVNVFAIPRRSLLIFPTAEKFNEALCARFYARVQILKSALTSTGIGGGAIPSVM